MSERVFHDFGTLARTLEAELERRTRLAYESGFKAGVRAAPEKDPEMYRRGYLSGYAAGQRNIPLDDEGEPVRKGRPRRSEVV